MHSEGSRKRHPRTQIAQVEWRDVLLSIRYQSNLMDAYRSRGLDRGMFSVDGAANADLHSEETACLPFVMPLDHFHGPTFHAAMHEYRRDFSNRSRLEDEAFAGEEGVGGAGTVFLPNTWFNDVGIRSLPKAVRECMLYFCRY